MVENAWPGLIFGKDDFDPLAYHVEQAAAKKAAGPTPTAEKVKDKDDKYDAVS